MSLTIRFINKTDYEPCLALGEIRLNDFFENFETPLTLWGAERYERQWREGIDRLLDGAATSCLITSMHDRKYEHFGTWWKLYREDDQVVIQNQLLLADVFGNFDPDEPYQFIPERRSYSGDDRAPISEWVIAFDTIEPL